MLSNFSEIDVRATVLYGVLFTVAGLAVFNFGTYFAANIIELNGSDVEIMVVGLAFLLSALPAFIMKAVYEANLAARD